MPPWLTTKICKHRQCSEITICTEGTLRASGAPGWELNIFPGIQVPAVQIHTESHQNNHHPFPAMICTGFPKQDLKRCILWALWTAVVPSAEWDDKTVSAAGWGRLKRVWRIHAETDPTADSSCSVADLLLSLPLPLSLPPLLSPSWRSQPLFVYRNT